jgi:hypothetical protein
MGWEACDGAPTKQLVANAAHLQVPLTVAALLVPKFPSRWMKQITTHQLDTGQGKRQAGGFTADRTPANVSNTLMTDQQQV